MRDIQRPVQQQCSKNTNLTVRHTLFFFKERFITQTVYTGCTRINYKIVPVTNFNKYLYYGASGNE